MGFYIWSDMFSVILVIFVKIEIKICSLVTP
jgi:hypothetical protein